MVRLSILKKFGALFYKAIVDQERREKIGVISILGL